MLLNWLCGLVAGRVWFCVDVCSRVVAGSGILLGGVLCVLGGRLVVFWVPAWAFLGRGMRCFGSWNVLFWVAACTVLGRGMCCFGLADSSVLGPGGSFCGDGLSPLGASQ